MTVLLDPSEKLFETAVLMIDTKLVDQLTASVANGDRVKTTPDIDCDT